MQQMTKLVRVGFLATILLLFTLTTTFAADSGEFQVHTDNEGRWDHPAVATDPNGNSVVVWHRISAVFGDSYDVYARRYDSTGTPLGDEFRVNKTTSNLQRRPDVAMDANGNWVVVWEGYDDSSLGIYGQRFDKDGNPAGSEFLVNTATANQQQNPAVAMDASGNFFVVYETYASGSFDIAGRRFASDGAAQGEEFPVHASASAQLTPDITINATGQAVVVWQSRDTFPYSISARRYDGGMSLGDNFTISSETGAAEPAVAVDANGNFTVVWEQCCDSFQTATGVYARRFNDTATPLGTDFLVNSTVLGWQREADIAMTGTGEFVVAWNGSLSGYETNIYAQYFLNDGTPSGPEFRINERFDYLQMLPSVAIDDNGRFATVWRSQTGGFTPASVGIFGRVLDGPPLTNSAPGAVDDSYTMDEDTSLTVPAAGVLTNDLDADGDPLSAIDIVKLQRVGESFNFNTDGSFDFTPYANFNGTRTFTYIAGDSTLDSNEATVTITVNPVPDPPVARDDRFSISEDTETRLNASGNDYDPDGPYDPGSSDDLDPTTLAITSGPAHGTIVNNGDGSVNYTPFANYNGNDSFTYQICDGTDRCDTATANITVSSVNDAPLAVDDSYSVNEDNSLSVTAPGVLNNDSDPDGDPMTVALDTGVSHGALTLNGDGSFIYTPDADYHGLDTFSYTASDGELTSGVATVTIEVLSVNDLPVAVDDAATTNQGVPITIDVASNDTDIDGNLDITSVSVTGAPGYGTVTNRGDGTVTYTPDAAYSGADSFVYRICDTEPLCAEATVTITINATNSAPVASDDSATTDEDTAVTIDIAANDNDLDGNLDSAGISITTPPAHGELTNHGDGTVTYIPVADYYGPDSFSYQICDSADLCDTATVTIDVLPVNDPPVPNAGGPYSGDEGALIALSGTASDVEGDGLSHAWSSDGPCTFSDPTILNPTLTCDDDGTFTATLTIDDGVASSSMDATVTVKNVTPTIDLSGDSPIDEGAIYTLTLGAVSDPGDDTVTEYIVYWGDGSSDSYSTGGDVFHAYSDGPASYGIRVDLVDEDGTHIGACCLIARVNNVAPTIDAIVAPIDPVAVDLQPIEAIVEFSDPGIADSHTTVIDWGDGARDTFNGPSPVSASHTYAEAGVYTLNITVTDDDGGTASATYEYVVIYDPDGGFVTGHGRIYSEAGWCYLDNLCNSAEGNARFGFVSRYNKGDTVPTGRTDFVFRAGNLNFGSDQYEWLIVTGSNYAKFKGSGTINGALAPNNALYKFQIWAGDGTGSAGDDTFRIKIWYEVEGTETVVYDNGFDQAIGGGNIKVQSK